MLKAIGKSFLDVFKKPFLLLWVYVVFVAMSFVFSLIGQYTVDYIPDSTANMTSMIMYYIRNHILVVLLYFLLFLFAIYVASLIIAYVVNKKRGANVKFVGTGKIFGFTLFLSIVSLVPYLFLGLFEPGWVVSILMLLVTLLLIFLVYPAIFFVVVLLPSYDLRSALSKSWAFAKKKLGRIALLEILVVIFMMILSAFLDFVEMYIGVFAILIYILIYVVLFLWGVYFTFDWYYQI